MALRSHWGVGGPIIGSNSLVYDKPTIDPKRTIVSGLPFPQIGVFSFNTVVCDIEIDEASGKTIVLEAWSACDIGKAINPMSVEGQIQGGFVQGLGFALFEEVVWDGARIANPSLMDYKIATTLDVPAQISIRLLSRIRSRMDRSARKASARFRFAPSLRQSPMASRRQPACGYASCL